MNRTVRLELTNAAGRAPVAGQVVLALAIACGTGPLAAERLRRSAEAAAAAATGGLTIHAEAQRGALALAFSAAPEDGWADRAFPILEPHGAVRTPAGVDVRAGAPVTPSRPGCLNRRPRRTHHRWKRPPRSIPPMTTLRTAHLPRPPPRQTAADREALILRHAKLVRSIARRYTGRGLAYDDIVQSGYIGLIQAVDRFDPSRGVPLRAYAARTIEGEIMHLFRDRGWALRVPRSLQEMSRRMAALSERMSHRLGRPPTAGGAGRGVGRGRRARLRGSVGAARLHRRAADRGPRLRGGRARRRGRPRAERRRAGVRRRASPRHARAGDPAAAAA